LIAPVNPFVQDSIADETAKFQAQNGATANKLKQLFHLVMRTRLKWTICY